MKVHAHESLAQENAPAAEAKPRSIKPLLQMLGSSTWAIASLFLGAGRLGWMRAWICVALWIVGMTTIGLISYHHNAVADAGAGQVAV